MKTNLNQKKGKVYIVGAGPGDLSLITLKAQKCIEEADVIVYDRLISTDILMIAKSSSEFIYVGKQVNNHIVNQSEINKILVNKALESKIVVRLKGGDPFIFGRGGEEAEELKKFNIDYEIVPGISSSYAVCEYAGIPITHRDYSSSFHVITGHNKVSNDLDYKSFSNIDGTLIFLMGIANLETIVSQLIEGGKPKDTPTAIIQNGTTNNQKEVYGTLANICDLAKQNKIESPAIIVIGRVVTLADKLKWITPKSLNGKKIIITRASHQMSDLTLKLKTQGAEVFQIPVIKILDNNDNSKIGESLTNLKAYSWVVFTSVNGVNSFFENLKKYKIDIRSLNKVAAIGDATKKALEDKGIFVDFMPENYTTEYLASGLVELLNNGDKVLLPRSNIADKAIINILESKGIICCDLAIYKTCLDNRFKNRLLDILNENKIDYITFSSSSTVDNFITLLGIENKKLLDNIKLVCIGEITALCAAKYELKNIMISKLHNIDGIVNTILND